METQEGIYFALNFSGDKAIVVLTIILFINFTRKDPKLLKEFFRILLNFLFGRMF